VYTAREGVFSKVRPVVRSNDGGPRHIRKLRVQRHFARRTKPADQGGEEFSAELQYCIRIRRFDRGRFVTDQRR
jgi:hypothetical protein